MIPDYQTLMLPLLRCGEDGKEHHIRDVIEPLAKHFGLGENELAEMLPSGKQPLLNNRVHWAKTYLAQAKLLEITRRAHFQITQRGRDVLKENPTRVDVQLLERFPEFNEFKTRSREAQKAPSSSPPPAQITDLTTKLATPDELLRTTIADLEAVLANDCWTVCSPRLRHSLKA
jgi:restriction system protein